MRLFLILALFLLSFSILAQEIQIPEPITSDNISQLQSVDRLDFSSDIYMPPLSPQGEIEYFNNQFNIGWFVYSAESERFLLIDVENTLRAVSTGGAMTYSLPDVDMIDGVAFGDEFYAILFKTASGFSVSYSNLSLYGGTSLRIDVTSSVQPYALWVTCPDNTNGIGCYASVEANDEDTTHVFRLPVFDIVEGSGEVLNLSDSEIEQYSYTPSTDEEAVVRIGRVPLPYVVTSSLDGIVKLWNLDTGEIVYDVNNGTDEPAVFGNINADATHLVWRDNFNETLYLLDFETGENREIAPLNGQYAQWYFLSNDASVIIAVNLGGEPNVVVWDTATGERTDLGNYRDCERPQPDMIRLTEDGTTLIIACDTGLDIWRINQGA